MGRFDCYAGMTVIKQALLLILSCSFVFAQRSEFKGSQLIEYAKLMTLLRSSPTATKQAKFDLNLRQYHLCRAQLMCTPTEDDICPLGAVAQCKASVLETKFFNQWGQISRNYECIVTVPECLKERAAPIKSTVQVMNDLKEKSFSKFFTKDSESCVSQMNAACGKRLKEDLQASGWCILNFLNKICEVTWVLTNKWPKFYNHLTADQLFKKAQSASGVTIRTKDMAECRGRSQQLRSKCANGGGRTLRANYNSDYFACTIYVHCYRWFSRSSPVNKNKADSVSSSQTRVATRLISMD